MTILLLFLFVSGSRRRRRRFINKNSTTNPFNRNYFPSKHRRNTSRIRICAKNDFSSVDESSRGCDRPVRIIFSSVVVVVACVGDGSDGGVSLEVYASLDDCFAEEMEDEFVGMEMGCWVGEAGFCGVDFGELGGFEREEEGLV